MTPHLSPSPLPLVVLPGPRSPASGAERGLHIVPDPIQPELLTPSRYHGAQMSPVQPPFSHLIDKEIKAQHG